MVRPTEPARPGGFVTFQNRFTARANACAVTSEVVTSTKVMLGGKDGKMDIAIGVPMAPRSQQVLIIVWNRLY